MNQLEYISRQFSKAGKKPFEHYIVTRIWHQLDDTEIKFVTQQYVKRPEGIALTDIYFPQLKIHIEIDEGQHFTRVGNRVAQDEIREADIINATGHTVKRIVVAEKIDGTTSIKSLSEVNKQVAEMVHLLKNIKQETANFKAWSYEGEQNPHTYVNLGYIDLQDDVAFRTIVNTVKCFGREYMDNGIRRGGVQHPIEKGKIIWFPKLYENKDWNNSISNDDNEIREIPKNEEQHGFHFNWSIEKANITRIVFAQVVSPLGDIMYRFKGEYALNLEKTNQENMVVYRRIATRVQTYPLPTTK